MYEYALRYKIIDCLDYDDVMYFRFLTNINFVNGNMTLYYKSHTCTYMKMRYFQDIQIFTLDLSEACTSWVTRVGQTTIGPLRKTLNR